MGDLYGPPRLMDGRSQGFQVYKYASPVLLGSPPATHFLPHGSITAIWETGAQGMQWRFREGGRDMRVTLLEYYY